jgi:restriction system protein
MSLRFSVAPPVHFALDRLFIGREKELRLLSKGFASAVQTALIAGPPGIGKTELAYQFLLSNPSLFPGGAAIEHSLPPSWLEFNAEDIAVHSVPKSRCLLIVNDAESLHREAFGFLYRIAMVNPQLALILTSRDPGIPHDMGIHLNLILDGLSASESAEFIRRRLEPPPVPIDVHERLYGLAEGNPTVLDLAAAAVRGGQLNWDELFRRLSSFDYAGILGPDGLPVKLGSVDERRIIADVTEVNDQLLRMLREKPEVLRLLPPRKFEEVVAQILKRLGYDIRLTPASGDGGFDIYAAKNDALGRFLFLVECKRFVPPNRVGVEIVRSLHGVVQSQKATAGIIATTSFFTSGAREFQKKNEHQLQLRDYLALQEWLASMRG